MIIEQEVFNDFKIEKCIHISLGQDADVILIDKTGAKQLIKVLQEFVNENQD